MNPQMTCLGFKSSRRSHIDFAPERSCGWNSREPSAAFASKTPSHLLKNGQSRDVDPEFITSKAVRPAAADEPDAAFALRCPRALDIIEE